MGNCGSTQEEESSLKEILGDHLDCINCVAVSEDQSIIVTGSEDATARIWSTTDHDDTDCLGVLRSDNYLSTVMFGFLNVHGLD